MPSQDGGLGTALVGEKITINSAQIVVNKLLGEGGFAYVYLVKDIGDSADGKIGDDGKKGKSSKSKDKGDSSSSKNSGKTNDASTVSTDGTTQKFMVLKVTSILSKQQRDIAEKEAKLLSRLSHPSIVKVFDTCYRTVPASSSSTSAFGRKSDKATHKEMTQHLILMEFCEGGHAMGVCTQLRERNERFDLSTLIIAFGQICNAVSYLHAQRPPIVHRDLKPENFLIKNGAYKLCDFGSAVFGHIELKTPQARAEAEEEIQKTTTQMFRSPEMVDLYMAKRLTQATDVWALGCCLYSLAYLQNCFEEGSNLAILSRKYKIPDDNPYGNGLVELIDRMLTIDSKARADMTEVILCLSAVYSGSPLPPRKERSKKKKEGEKDDEVHDVKTSHEKEKKEKVKKTSTRTGSYRTDGQGIHSGDNLAIDPRSITQKPKEAKKLDPNSAAARRRLAASAGGDTSSLVSSDFTAFDHQFEKAKQSHAQHPSVPSIHDDLAFSTSDNPFATSAFDGNDKSRVAPKRTASRGRTLTNGDWAANAKEGSAEAAFDALTMGSSSRSEQRQVSGRTQRETRDPVRRPRSKDVRRAIRRPSMKRSSEHDDTDVHNDDHDDEDDEEDNSNVTETNESKLEPTSPAKHVIKVIQSRGVRRVASGGLSRARSRSRGAGLRRSSSRHANNQKADGSSNPNVNNEDDSHEDDDEDDDDDKNDDGEE